MAALRREMTAGSSADNRGISSTSSFRQVWQVEYRRRDRLSGRRSESEGASGREAPTTSSSREAPATRRLTSARSRFSSTTRTGAERSTIRNSRSRAAASPRRRARVLVTACAARVSTSSSPGWAAVGSCSPRPMRSPLRVPAPPVSSRAYAVRRVRSSRAGRQPPCGIVGACGVMDGCGRRANGRAVLESCA